MLYFWTAMASVLYKTHFTDGRSWTLVPVWFASLVKFIVEGELLNSVLLSSSSISTDSSCDFGYIGRHLLNSELGSITVYTDSSIKDLDLVQACDGAAAYFPDVNTSVGFRNKVKGHSGVIGNKRADFYTNTTVTSEFFLSLVVSYCFLNVEDRPVSENTCHVTKKLFNAVHFVGWKARCVGSVISMDLFIFHKGASSSLSTLLSNAALKWSVLLDASANSNIVAVLLNKAATFMDLFTALAKMVNTLDRLGANSDKSELVMDFVHHFAESHKTAVWLLAAKLRAYYKKYNLLPHDSFSIPSVSGLSFLWSTETIWNFGFRLGIHVCFGLYSCLASLDFGFLHGFLVIRNLGV
ncbi:hypothetical protein G9A89_022180 [Geosiphon pyriformis]|nr:hypothetical protein G9A89_022180 [Geosiphon pyriformis]